MKKTFSCISDNLENIPKELIESKNLKFPNIHENLIDMVKFSKIIKEHKKDLFCRVPFCMTVEAESLGAKINMGDEKYGPRAKEYAFKTLDELEIIKPIDLTNGRIKIVLDAIHELKESGEIPILAVEGPITIISSLMESRIFYKELKKNPERMNTFLNFLEDEIVKYILSGIENGAKIISFGDPAGSIDIVGPKVFREYSGKIAKNIIEKVKSQEKNCIIHVCGKTSVSLENEGMYEFNPINCNSETYGKALHEIIHENTKTKIIGHNCIKKSIYKIPKNTIWEIKE
uniref:Uroporphyrinogen decarboxylase (URO-D) n=1 Tax=Methanococcus maripaludis (strain C6 / ATCC BAA-1332) TaxID=444158 RepID=A9ABB0_METM6